MKSHKSYHRLMAIAFARQAEVHKIHAEADAVDPFIDDEERARGIAHHCGMADNYMEMSAKQQRLADSEPEAQPA